MYLQRLLDFGRTFCCLQIYQKTGFKIISPHLFLNLGSTADENCVQFLKSHQPSNKTGSLVMHCARLPVVVLLGAISSKPENREKKSHKYITLQTALQSNVLMYLKYGRIFGGICPHPPLVLDLYPISSMGADYTHPIATGLPRFSYLPTALHCNKVWNIL